MKKLFLTLTFTIICTLLFSQTFEQQMMYKKAFDEMMQMIKGEKPVNFKRAVFLYENAHYNNTLDYQKFCAEIDVIAHKVRQIIKSEPPDVQKFKTIGNWAIFMYMTQPSNFNNNKPFVYDFENFLPSHSPICGFVTKLLNTGKGNCHSLPYLYKILADEIGANTTTIAYAPRHVYIKHRDEEGEWRNVELTNGSISRDIWMMQTLNIEIKQISSGLYMRALSEKEIIAACIFDLINDYERRFKLYNHLTLAMIESVAAYFPKFHHVIMMRADNYEDLIKAEYQKQNPDKQLISKYRKKINESLQLMKEIGYKKIPDKEYRKWVEDAMKEKIERDKEELRKQINNQKK